MTREVMEAVSTGLSQITLIKIYFHLPFFQASSPVLFCFVVGSENDDSELERQIRLMRIKSQQQQQQCNANKSCDASFKSASPTHLSESCNNNSSSTDVDMVTDAESEGAARLPLDPGDDDPSVTTNSNNDHNLSFNAPAATTKPQSSGEPTFTGVFCASDAHNNNNVNSVGA